MKIYTKKGDKGTTQLIGGLRIEKHHIKIEAYGTVDELNAHIGLLRDQNINKKHIDELLKIQDCLFTIGSQLANDSKNSSMKLPEIQISDVTFLENSIDQIENEIPLLKSFILPGGHTIVSYCHIARCVCRRAERKTTHLNEKENVNQINIIYLNRLSDYLFVLARKLAQDLNVSEQKWTPKLDI
jgi:cob(I)alamin adenosyltransferase